MGTGFLLRCIGRAGRIHRWSSLNSVQVLDAISKFMENARSEAATADKRNPLRLAAPLDLRYHCNLVSKVTGANPETD